MNQGLNSDGCRAYEMVLLLRSRKKAAICGGDGRLSSYFRAMPRALVVPISVPDSCLSSRAAASCTIFTKPHVVLASSIRVAFPPHLPHQLIIATQDSSC